MTELLYDRVVAAIGEHYELETEIGRGGMSVVYRARDRRLNRPVAIKVLPPELAYDPAIRTRFTREAQTSARLTHPHIVPIYDVGEREGIAYFVMSVVTGGNLAELLAREPRQPIAEVRRLLCEIADALAYAHLRGVIHRDVKPDNILLERESGRAMVTDFGIARAMEGGTRLTITGNAVGTPTYMSPEQAMGERELDGRSDIYSLGVLGYQMITGRVPFTAGNSMALLLKHVGEEARPIADLRPETPRALREAVERAMKKSPEDRWPSASALRDALNAQDAPAAAWRAEQREPVRYASPRPDGARTDSPPRDVARVERPREVSPRRGTPVTDARPPAPIAVPRTPTGLVLEPEHLAGLTPEQRKDLRLWHGRVNLVDRIRAARVYLPYTLVMTGLGIAGFVVGIEEGVPPGVLAPIVPGYMWWKLWRRSMSLRDAGLQLRRVFLMPRWTWVIPKPLPVPTDKQLMKLAPPEILESPYGVAIRRAADDRAAILDIFAHLPKPDRSLLPDLQPTVNALVERVANLAQMLHRLEQSIDANGLAGLDGRIAEMEKASDTPDGQRRLGLLRRQRTTLAELVQRREALARQLESAGLALGNLRLDLIKLRSSGIQSALNDVSTATQEARALSKEIGVVLDAAAEVRGL
ncbi:MAG TPA: serine/threonine-protein kinase [Gemmatimonadaceae bacterium]|nr:serine/threonine-protein kinase [Gemmatimonadaceae bacterium]